MTPVFETQRFNSAWRLSLGQTGPLPAAFGSQHPVLNLLPWQDWHNTGSPDRPKFDRLPMARALAAQLCLLGWPAAALVLEQEIQQGNQSQKILLALNHPESQKPLLYFYLVPELTFQNQDYLDFEGEAAYEANEVSYAKACVTDGRRAGIISFELGDGCPEWGQEANQYFEHLPRPQDLGLSVAFDSGAEARTVLPLAHPTAFDNWLQAHPETPLIIEGLLHQSLRAEIVPEILSSNPAPTLLDAVLAGLSQWPRDFLLCLPAPVLGLASSQPLRQALLEQFYLRSWHESADGVHCYAFTAKADDLHQSQGVVEISHHSGASLSWQPDPEAELPWLLNDLLPPEQGFPAGFFAPVSELERVLPLAECVACLTLDDLQPDDLVVSGSDPRHVGVWQSDIGLSDLGQASELLRGRNLLVLRPRPEIRSQFPWFDSDYLWAYLRSQAVQDYLQMLLAGTLGPSLSPRLLGPLPVILRPVEPGLLAALRQLHQGLRFSAGQLLSAPPLLFASGQNPDTLRADLHQLRATGELMLQSAADLQRVDYQVCHYYPFVLAYPYRSLQSQPQAVLRYQEQLRLVENLLAFLAGLLLAWLRQISQGQDTFNPLAFNPLTGWQKGMSPGDWRALYAAALTALTEQESQTPDFVGARLLAELNGLHLARQHKGLGQVLDQLIQSKNDFKHDRGPKTEDGLEAASRQLSQRLDRLLGSMNFFKDYPFWQVQALNKERFTGSYILSCLKLMGDHPAFFQEELLSVEAFAKDDVIWELEPGRFLSLYPFLTAHTCPLCQRSELFFIDRLKAGQAQLKSYERGHGLASEQIQQDLKRILVYNTPSKQV